MVLSNPLASSRLLPEAQHAVAVKRQSATMTTKPPAPLVPAGLCLFGWLATPTWAPPCLLGAFAVTLWALEAANTN